MCELKVNKLKIAALLVFRNEDLAEIVRLQ